MGKRRERKRREKDKEKELIKNLIKVIAITIWVQIMSKNILVGAVIILQVLMVSSILGILKLLKEGKECEVGEESIIVWYKEEIKRDPLNHLGYEKLEEMPTQKLELRMLLEVRKESELSQAKYEVLKEEWEKRKRKGVYVESKEEKEKKRVEYYKKRIRQTPTKYIEVDIIRDKSKLKDTRSIRSLKEGVRKEMEVVRYLITKVERGVKDEEEREELKAELKAKYEVLKEEREGLSKRQQELLKETQEEKKVE